MGALFSFKGEFIMVTLYSGTPGSGKSLHMAERIFTHLFMGRPVIGNFLFNDSMVKFKKSRYVYIPNWELTPQKLIDFSIDYQKEHGRVKEGTIKVFIDEAQLIFNSRDYGMDGRKEWLQFFTLHRHYGIDIILACQFDRMLDRQIRCLIEYEYIHRKVSNFGWKGKILNILMGGRMFACSKRWYPLKEPIGGEFFRFKKKYSKCYDTFDLSINDREKALGVEERQGGSSITEFISDATEGGQGVPTREYGVPYEVDDIVTVVSV